MSRISKILDSVRYTLGDRDGSRWPDTRLLQLLDEGQKDLVRQTKLLRKTSFITPQDYNEPTIYQLPEDFMVLTKATYEDEKLNIVSHENLDEINSKWEQDTTNSTPEALVYDRLNQGLVRIYPKPVTGQVDNYVFENAGYLEDISYELSSDFGVIIDGEDGDTFTGDFGITTDMDYLGYVFNGEGPGLAIVDDFESLDENGSPTDFGLVVEIEELLKDTAVRDSTYGFVATIEDYTVDSDFGCLATLRDEDIVSELFSSDFGCVADITEQATPPQIKIYYVYKPSEITSINDTLEVNDNWDQAFKHYVAGRALRDDMDAQNRQMGGEELQLYAKELLEAMRQSSEDFTRKTYVQTTYNRGVF